MQHLDGKGETNKRKTKRGAKKNRMNSKQRLNSRSKEQEGSEASPLKSPRTAAAKTSAPTTPTSLSTPPKKRKNLTLANLHSDLSPKYIGFASSPLIVDTDMMPDETATTKRVLRSRVCSIVSPTRLVENDNKVIPNVGASIEMLLVEMKGTSPVRKSPSLCEPFVSPIDKLLLKNGSTTVIPICDFSLNMQESERLQRVDRVGREALKSVTQLTKTTDHDQRINENVDVEALIPFNMIEDVREVSGGKGGAVDLHECSEMDDSLNDDGMQQDTPAALSMNSDEIVAVPESLVVVTMNNDDNYNNTTLKETLDTEEAVELAEDVDGDVVAAVDSAAIKSPSAISLDSAKGSSVVNDASPCMSFATGDLYWGQIYTYCFWPCMVCPDPEERVITTQASRNGATQMLVHVRFFADNGRRNWVKCENLLLYYGLDQHRERVTEVAEKYGTKSAKYKVLLPKRSREATWYNAINEADMLVDLPNTERLEQFFVIYKETRIFQQIERKRRNSLLLPPESITTSDQCSVASDDWDQLSMRQPPSLATASSSVKRERSSSPFSPAYSPIKPSASKRRKLSQLRNAAEDDGATDQLLLLGAHQTVSQAAAVELYKNKDFRKFYAAIKDFALMGGGRHNDEKLEHGLLVAVRNIWELRAIRHNQEEQRFFNEFNAHELGSTLVDVNRLDGGSMKRLSNRLKGLLIRRSLPPPVAAASDKEAPAIVTPQQQAQASEERPKHTLNRPIEEVIDDIYDLDRKYLFRGLGREPICKYCYQSSANLQRCSKDCHAWLHADCTASAAIEIPGRSKRRPPRTTIKATTIDDLIEKTDESEQTSSMQQPVATDALVCDECRVNPESRCRVCNSSTGSDGDTAPTSTAQLVACSMPHCESTYHRQCCRYWPQAKFTMSQHKIQSFRCPSHVCHTCVSDDPKGKFQNLSNSKLTRCVKCPATYHTDSTCIPAGSIMLNAARIICPRHSSNRTDAALNVSWCFICVGGGQLVCCDTCPTAVHAQCLNINIEPNDDAYICEECESGRLPLYGEIVWAKFNAFRWWPAIILPPPLVPQNIARKAHNDSDFVVRFFGTHDHGWISRRRVYLYVEGDSSQPPKSKSHMDQNYVRGVDEAKRAYELIKSKKLIERLTNAGKEKLHPQPYVRIKTNRAVPPLKLHINLEMVNKCECVAYSENPCAADTNCLNRVLYHECNPKVCPAGDLCQNQMFESRISPRLDVIYMGERGFGLICREAIDAGSFVIEYVGEIINHAEFQQRLAQKSIDRDENFYFFLVEKDYIIDAGPKGNLARFVNHSCDPNCETQKWLVNGLNRVGLFAIKDIPADTELTFNYHWDELLGSEKKTCYCGAGKCAGQIGGKYREDKSKVDGGGEEPAHKFKAAKHKLKRKVLKNGKPRANKASRGRSEIRVIITKPTKVKKPKKAGGAASIPTTPVTSAEAVDDYASAVDQQHHTSH